MEKIRGTRPTGNETAADYTLVLQDLRGGNHRSLFSYHGEWRRCRQRWRPPSGIQFRAPAGDRQHAEHVHERGPGPSTSGRTCTERTSRGRPFSLLRPSAHPDGHCPNDQLDLLILALVPFLQQSELFYGA